MPDAGGRRGRASPSSPTDHRPPRRGGVSSPSKFAASARAAAALAVVAAVLLGGVEAHAQTDTTPVWSTTMLVASTGGNSHGYHSSVGSLAEEEFEYGSVTYTVQNLSVSMQRVDFTVNKGGLPTTDTLTLELGGHEFPFSARASGGTRQWFWTTPPELDDPATEFPVGATVTACLRTATQTCPAGRIEPPSTEPVWSATMTAGDTQAGHGYEATDAPDAPAIGGLDADPDFDYGSTSYQVTAIDVASNVVRFVVAPTGLALDETLTLEFGGHALPFSDRLAAVSILGSVVWAVPEALDDLENEFPVGSTATVCLRTATQTCPAGRIVTPSKPTLSIAAANGREDGDVTFTATLSAVAEEDVTATWTASIGSGDTAVAADLGTTKTGTVTVPMGELTGTFDVPTTDDSTDEADETFTVTLSGVSANATLGTATATGTIRDDDQPVASMADAAPVIEGGAASFTLTLSPASARELQLTYSVASLTTDTAVEEVDFPYVEEKVTFAAGEVSKTITVATTDDPYDEDAETFTVTVFSALVAFEGGTPFLEATGTINDNDDPPTLSVADVSAGEGGDLTFTVELSAESEREVSVAWAAAARDAEGDDAEEGADFAAASGTLTFAPRTHAIDRFADLTTTTPGETARTFTVSTTDDAVDEADETFTVTLSNPTNATIPDATAKGTITSDDTPAVTGVTVTSVPVLETDTYGAGETIEVAVDFSAPVNAAAGTDLVLSVGGAERAALLRGSGTQTLVFGYTVQPGDEDDDGIWMGDGDRTLAGNRNGTPQNGAITSVATGLDAVLDHDAPGRQSGHKVDGTRSIVSVEVSSTPQLETDTYGAGETIEFTVTFNTEVDVAGDPVVEFLFDGAEVRQAALETGRGTTDLVFAYTVVPGDVDDNGLFLQDESDYDDPDGPVRPDSDDEITFAGTSTGVPLYWEGQGTQSGHKVDGSRRTDNREPAFDGSLVSLIVPENSPAGTDVGTPVTATDADDDTLTYSLEGTEAASFAIDSATGQITTATDVDHEVKDHYSMTAKAEDGFGGSDTVIVTINVTDVEEQSDTPAKPELAKVTGSSTSLAATWAEPGRNGGPAIAGYNLEYRVSPDGDWMDFAYTGTAVTATVTGLTADTDYQVRVQALNDETPSVWSDPSDVLRTNRVNNPPSFTTSALPDVAENVSAAGTVEAVDGDAGDDVTGYAIAGGADRALFEIGATDGVLSFATAPNFEDPKDQDADNTYEVTVEAASGAGDREATATRTFTVTVTDVAEQSDTPAAPTLAAVTGSSTSLAATWAEPGLNGGPAIAGYNLAYRVSPDGDWMYIAHTGTAVTATVTGLTASTDYQVRVQALNGETPSVWSHPSEAERTNRSDTPPSFTSRAAFSVPENVAAVGTVVAVDGDAGDDVTGYAIAGGADQALFEIDAESGALSFMTAPDFESPQDQNADNTYAVTVEATSGAGAREKTATQAIAVTVTNVATEFDLVWYTTMTVGDTGGGKTGYSATRPAGMLDDDDFEYGSPAVTYTVGTLDVATKSILFNVDTNGLPTTDTLTLELAGQAFPFSARKGGSSRRWTWTTPDELDDPATDFPVGTRAPVCLRTATQTCPSTDMMMASKPTLSVADASGAEGDGVEFTATLTAGVSGEVTATWTASIGSGDTASAADLATAKTGEVEFEANATTATFTVPVNNDTDNEADETFTVTLSGVSTNAQLAADPTATGTITNDDVPAEPADFRAGVGDTQVELTWDAPATGANITRHEVRRKEGSGSYPAAFTPIPASAPGGANEKGYTVTGLTNEVAYTFELRAVNDAGAGTADEAGPVTPTPGICGRTQQVREAIVDYLTDRLSLSRTCEEVNKADLKAAITG